MISWKLAITWESGRDYPLSWLRQTVLLKSWLSIHSSIIHLFCIKSTFIPCFFFPFRRMWASDSSTVMHESLSVRLTVPLLHHGSAINCKSVATDWLVSHMDWHDSKANQVDPKPPMQSNHGLGSKPNPHVDQDPEACGEIWLMQVGSS